MIAHETPCIEVAMALGGYFIVITYLSGACIYGQSALPLEDSDEVFVVLCALEDLLFVYATEDGVIDS